VARFNAIKFELFLIRRVLTFWTTPHSYFVAPDENHLLYHRLKTDAYYLYPGIFLVSISSLIALIKWGAFFHCLGHIPLFVQGSILLHCKTVAVVRHDYGKC